MEAVISRRCAEHRSRDHRAWIAPLTATLAGTACAAIWVVARLLGAIPQNVLVSGPAGKEPLTLGLAVTAATVSSTLAFIVYCVIERFSPKPVKLFRIVALAVLVLSIASPFSVSDAPGSMIATLLAMHVSVAAVIVWSLTTTSFHRWLIK